MAASPNAVLGFGAATWFFARDLYERYHVPIGIINLIVVRVTNSAGKGGFVPDKRYELTDGVTHVDIRGDWQYKVGQVFSADRLGGSPPPFSAQNEPAGLYNTMVAPAIRYTLKGFLWYQGEANTGRPLEYRQLLPSLIADWRGLWGQGPLPFLYVQLPNFMEVQYSPSESQWAELREMERLSLTVPNTGMAVTIDAGEWNDIHPLDKKDVGDRLALLARRLAYGEHDLVASGPLFASADVRGSTIVVHFSSVGGGLIARDGGLAGQGGTPLRQFAVAGADRKFFWADARSSETASWYRPKTCRTRCMCAMPGRTTRRARICTTGRGCRRRRSGRISSPL